MHITKIEISAQGGPEMLQVADAELPPPGASEIQIDQSAIGINYMDVYQRSGHYPLQLPAVLGLEAAGKVLAVGSEVSDIAVGDRVVYAGLPGAYASARNLPAARAIVLPDTIDDRQAAAVFMKGITVHYLLTRMRPITAGDWVLFYAASGGVGQLAGQWGKHLGARMIGVTSGEENCRQALANGYEFAIDRTSQSVSEQVAEITSGEGVAIAFDSVGKASFDATLASMARFGLFVSFGATTGEAPPVAPSVLQKNGSLFFSRPTLADYARTRADLESSAAALFELMQTGVLKVHINQTFDLTDAAAAHRALEAGETTGSSLLLP